MRRFSCFISGVAGALVVLLSVAVPALADTGHAYSSSFGAGELKDPTGVAVNDATGDVYVLDQGDSRIVYFSAEGVKLGEFNGAATPAKEFAFDGGELGNGIAIDNSCYLRKLAEPTCQKEDPSNGDVYVTDTGGVNSVGHSVVDKFEANGKYVDQIVANSTGTRFSEAGAHGLVGVAVDQNGNVWVSQPDFFENATTGGEAVSEYGDGLTNESTTSIHQIGAVFSVFGFVNGFAVDSEDNLFAVTEKGHSGIDKFNSNGEPIAAEKFGGLEERASAVSVDLADDDVYIDHGAGVAEVEDDGTVIHKAAGAGHLTAGSGIGVNSVSNVLYVADSTGDDVAVLSPGTTPSSPETGEAKEITATSAMLHGKLSAKQNYYFEYKAGSSCTGTSESPSQTTLSVGGEGEVTAQVTGLEPSKEYAFCLVAENAYGSAIGSAVTFPTLGEKPTILAKANAFNKSGERGVFEVGVNPNNQETTYEFQYSTEAEGETLKGAVQVAGGGPISANEFGESIASVSIRLEERSDTYYYRIIASNASGTSIGEVHAYTKLPGVSGEAASGLTLTEAKLEAKVNPDFQETEYRIEYAESKEALEHNDGKVVEREKFSGEEKPVGAELSGLIPYARYFYRVVAENPSTENPTNADEGRPVYGPIESFVTRSLPIPNTGEAVAVTPTSAALAGTVIPPFVEAAYYYEYISEARYDEALALGASNPYAQGEVTLSATVKPSESPEQAGPSFIGGLLPETPYDYRLVSKNEFGWQYGANHTFRTGAGTPPTVSTGGASNIGQTAATLSGTITTNGLKTNYGFEIGTEPGNYGPATGSGSLSGSTTETVSLTLNELQPGTTYYYRVTAANADGTVFGAPELFTTPGLPDLLTVSPAAPQLAGSSLVFPGSATNTVTAKKVTSKHSKKHAKKKKKANKMHKRSKKH
jgi:DNA-binding beta-propeller fold protein YncE